MMDFLTLCNISDTTINKIIDNNSQSLLSDVSCNGGECMKIIEYMKELNIKCIDDLLINYLSIFLMDLEKFVKRLSKLNVPYFVQCLNEDIDTIEFIYE